MYINKLIESFFQKSTYIASYKGNGLLSIHFCKTHPPAIHFVRVLRRPEVKQGGFSETTLTDRRRDQDVKHVVQNLNKK